ncbi:N-acetylglutamate synthase [Sulfurivirga caldicuralii]|uniref:Amino-acid acetyltransferase n=1 Tax=Sulfurivirga caldicuralii TaxID=364032 RepID=A0A1N6DWZ6_9GAMM|nr:amino-acid N-acetyltransferase [Sulfurivirga caldicuralii]SIN75233.1 N-acetylglutamate synthase [Sulfurivirga caldicuralii]
MTHNDPFITALRQASPYILGHRDKTCVVYLASELVADEKALRDTLADLLLLHNMGLKLVLAVGLREQFTHALQEKGLQCDFCGQQRVTPAEALPILAGVSGRVATQLQALASCRCPVSDLRTLPPVITLGNWVIAQPRGVLNGTDFQHTGRVRKVQVDMLRHALNSGQIPMLTAVTPSFTGELFNLNAFEQACAVASALRSDKLIVLLPQDQLPTLPKQLNARELQKNQSKHQLLPQLAEVSGAVRRIHLLDAFAPGALLKELFTRDGVGTLIFADQYHEIRQATIDDVGGILALIEPLEEAGILVRREREKLEAEIANFLVVVRDGHIIGCAALYPLDEHAAEVACFAVDPAYRGQGIGVSLLHAIEARACSLGLQRLYLLTTQTQHWFTQHGFVEVNPEDLPESRQALYNWQRRSRVYAKAVCE